MQHRSTTVTGKAGGSPAVRAGIALALTAAAAAILMMIGGAAAYPWIKAIHVVAIISWMAAMLYLPRLFIYHTDAVHGSELSETLKVMERRLLRIIMNPAMILAWVMGIWLAWQGGWLWTGWFQLKLLAVIALSGVHGFYAGAVRAFSEDRNKHTTRSWRIMNEVPAVLMVIIVILVIVKPF